jgi:SAM-dependent methyltransferase
MASVSPSAYATWHKDPAGDAAMADGHAPYWRHFIRSLPEDDIASKTVLDFGCNRGGFLRLLHALKPFRRGLGVDIATDSLAAAEAAKGALPLQFQPAERLGDWAESFDLAFSYEVIYLLPDLKGHAESLWHVMRDGGVYYAVTGCHTESPLWPRWRDLLAATSNAPVQDHAPNDFVDAFAAAGFDVSVRRFGYDGFVAGAKDRTYYPTVMDALAYPAEYKLMFRLEKRLG